MSQLGVRERLIRSYILYTTVRDLVNPPFEQDHEEALRQLTMNLETFRALRTSVAEVQFGARTAVFSRTGTELTVRFDLRENRNCKVRFGSVPVLNPVLLAESSKNARGSRFWPARTANAVRFSTSAEPNLNFRFGSSSEPGSRGSELNFGNTTSNNSLSLSLSSRSKRRNHTTVMNRSYLPRVPNDIPSLAGIPAIHPALCELSPKLPRHLAIFANLIKPSQSLCVAPHTRHHLAIPTPHEPCTRHPFVYALLARLLFAIAIPLCILTSPNTSIHLRSYPPQTRPHHFVLIPKYFPLLIIYQTVIPSSI